MFFLCCLYFDSIAAAACMSKDYSEEPDDWGNKCYDQNLGMQTICQARWGFAVGWVDTAIGNLQTNCAPRTSVKKCYYSKCTITCEKGFYPPSTPCIDGNSFNPGGYSFFLTATVSGCQIPTCTPCTNLPANAVYTSSGTVDSPSSCAWSCLPNYIRTGSLCLVSCPSGYFDSDNVCNICDLGQWCINSVATACAAGTYGNSTGLSSCFVCPFNSNSRSGASSISQCVCNIGFAGNASAGIICSACLAGK